ncbi:MAG TPA: alcohol dehydrogenase catalytic domain-containing protein [Terriglobia bacterium]|nr:alcohol dehydrogenase catalytic domain-containing protein [Terriglobia bacterium]
MRAVIFEGREKLRIVELPRPECGKGEVLLRVAACGVCGGDARSYFSGDQFTGKSRIPGHEVVGFIAETGEGIHRWKSGDRVALAADLHCGQCFYCRRSLFNMCDQLKILGKHLDGGLAEFMLLTSEILDHGVINFVPKQLPTLAAAISEPLCSVLASHDELQIEKGETVLVLGCGPMGILHLELLMARGARVLLADRAPYRVNVVRRDFGIELCIDSSQQDIVAWVRDLTGGTGADVVIVAAPTASAVVQSLQLVRKRGRVGIFGGLPAAQALVPIDVNRVHYGELRLIGNFSYHTRYHQKALEALTAGLVRTDKIITAYRLEETERALNDIKDANVLKAVVIPGTGEKS